MSRQIIGQTCINDHEKLVQACERMQQAGLDVSMPKRRDNYRTRRGETISGWAVRFPGWHLDAIYPCDGSMEVYLDNESPYYDDRPIGADGKRDSEATDSRGRKYPVHPKVASGEKRVGDDGRWGDISHAYELNKQYSQIVAESALTQHAATLSYSTDGDGFRELVFDIPE